MLPELLLVALVGAVPQWPVPERVELSILTIGPGEAYWQRFGHNAIWAEDPVTGQSVHYNWGVFDFEQPNFYLNFLLGRMQYRMVAFPAENEMARFLAEGRLILRQHLPLSAQQKQALLNRLALELRPARAEYRYDYFANNCSTKLRDALAGSVPDLFVAGLDVTQVPWTIREEVRRLSLPVWWMYAGAQTALGHPVDALLSVWDSLFIPMRLAQYLESQPGVRSEWLAGQGFAGPPSPPSLWPWALAIGSILALMLLLILHAQRVLGNVALAAVHGVLGTAGLALGFLWLGSDHAATGPNANLGVLSPFALWVGLRWYRPRPFGWPEGLLLAGALCTLLAALSGWQDSSELLAMAGPVLLLNLLRWSSLQTT